MQRTAVKPHDEPVVAPSMPAPTGFHILLALPEKKDKTAGGIHLPDETVRRESAATVTAMVVKIGPDAYQDKAKFPNGPWCKEGDWILIRAYSGTRFKVHGTEMRIINDDSVEAIIGDPRSIERAA